MTNFRRIVWVTVLFLALLAPFALVLVMALRNPRPSDAAIAVAQSQAKQEPPPLTSLLLHPPAAEVGSATATDAPLLAAGDGKTLWVVHPIMGGRDKKTPAYEVLARSSNTGTWTQVVVDGDAYFNGFPRALAMVPPGARGSGDRGAAYVFNGGGVARFTTESESLVDPLPGDHKILAVAGGDGVKEELFAVTAGPAHPSTTQPGDRLVLTTAPATTMAAGIATTTPAATGPATAPATRASSAAATAPAGPAVVNVFHLVNGHWVLMRGLSKPGADGVPSDQAYTALTWQGGRLLLAWVEPKQANVLMVRSLATGTAGAEWSSPVASTLPEPLPEHSRLMAVTLDKTVYLFWPVLTESSATVHGGWLGTNPTGAGDLTLGSKSMLPPLNAGAPAVQVGAEDVAVGPTENSLAVILPGKEGGLTCQVFDDRGRPLTKATAVSPKTGARDLQISQNIATLLLFVMLALSLWQWRQRPMALALPSGSMLAPLYLRACAFAIDLGIPFLIVAAFFGEGNGDSYGSIVATWIASFTNPDELLSSPAALYVFCAYLLHVTVGELFFRRSLGKALLGMQVLMMDGRAPTVLAVLVRNFVRIPEMLPGVLIVYVFISEHRQRLGDLFARTVVVSQQSPVMPEDPDAPQERKDADEAVGAGPRDKSR